MVDVSDATNAFACGQLKGPRIDIDRRQAVAVASKCWSGSSSTSCACYYAYALATATVCVGQRGIVQWLRKRISGGPNSTPGPHGARGQATTPNRKLDEPLWDMFGKLRIKCGSGYGEKGAQGVGEEGGRLGGNARGRRKKYCNVGADRAVANPSHSSAPQREAPENPASIKWGGIHDNEGRNRKGGERGRGRRQR
ncbi:hypothetical protein BC826DRAFT_969728 [Russula brevipes]|nr:hypothetical protein BC826DRAFT_969728 [Russula brevipes]